MTQQTLSRSFLKHSQPLLTKCLQAALIAAPALLAAAPSEAASVKSTVTGFTGEFAPANWAKLPSSISQGNSVTATSTDLTLVKNAGNKTPVSATISLTDSLFEALRPAGATGRILGYVATAKYDWSRTGTAANNRYAFNYKDPLTKLNNSTSNIIDGDIAISQSYVLNPFDPAFPKMIRFSIGRLEDTDFIGTGTGVIDNFEFVAEYEVPGPLPVVGAAAAFAWSRRLRKRLNSAKTLA